jgi:hypothetical protein
MAYRTVPIGNQSAHIPGMIQAAAATQTNLEGAGKVFTDAVTELDANKEDFYQKGVTGAENELANIKTEEELIEFQKNQMSNPNFRNDTKQDLIKAGVAKKQNIRDVATAEYNHQNTLEDRSNEPFLEEVQTFMSTANSNEDIATGRKMVQDMLASGQISERGAAEMNSKITTMSDPIRKELGYVSHKEALSWIQDNKGGNFDLSFDKFQANYQEKAWYNNLDGTQQGKVNASAKVAFDDARELSAADQSKLDTFTKQAVNRETQLREHYAFGEKKFLVENKIQAFHGQEELTYSELEKNMNEVQKEEGWDESNLGSQQLGLMKTSEFMPDGLNLTAADARDIYQLASADEGVGKVDKNSIDNGVKTWVKKKQVQIDNHSKYMVGKAKRDQRRDADIASIQAKPGAFAKEAKLIKLNRMKQKDAQYSQSSIFNLRAVQNGGMSSDAPKIDHPQEIDKNVQNALTAMKGLGSMPPQERGKAVAEQVKNIPTQAGKDAFLAGLEDGDKANYAKHKARIIREGEPLTEADMTDTDKLQYEAAKRNTLQSNSPTQKAMFRNQLNQFKKKYNIK